ncbi:hypothetical protein CNR22_14650 [Sphingobacteriaceae bacterium]|nr:hypothetical protein CNR22_14650 [Sphingobacteriaceae bacterium]
MLIFLSTLFSFAGFAQFSDSIHYHVNYTSTGNYNRTNTNRSYLLNNTINLNYRKKPLQVNFSNKWLYGKQQNSLVNNDFSSLLDVNLYKTFPHFYYWGLCNYNKSYSLRINNQLQAGLGVAYNLVDKVNFKINISEGVLYDYSDVILSDTTNDIYETPRNSARLQIKYYYGSLFTFAGSGYIQNSLEYGNDIIYKGDLDMAIRLRKWLSLTAKLTYNKIERTKRENLFMTYGFTVDKFF